MSLFGFGQNRKITRDNRNRAQRNLRQSRNTLEDRDEGVSDMIAQIVSAGEQAGRDGEQTVDDRFGRQLRSTQDRIQGDTAGAQTAISRALMAGGGDVTGSGAAVMADVTQRGNQAQGDAINQYSTMTEQMNQRDRQRGDNMLSRAMQGSESMARRGQQQYGMDRQLLNQADMQEIQRRQANRQFGLDIASTAIDTISPDFFG